MYAEQDTLRWWAAVRDLPRRPKVIVELGAQSLKVHTKWPRDVRTVRYEYHLGHEVYTTGFISRATILRIIDVCKPLADDSVLIVGTSAVRDAENREELVGAARRQLGLAIHPLSSQQEASLLAHGYHEYADQTPALVADIGGGSLEIVFLSGGGSLLWDSLPLGAIRLNHACRVDETFCPAERIDKAFQESAIVMSSRVFATGGTVKAMASVIGKTNFNLSEVAKLEQRVLRDGPPEDLKRSRARVFATGVTLVRRLMEFVRANEVCHIPIRIGRILMDVTWREEDRELSPERAKESQQSKTPDSVPMPTRVPRRPVIAVRQMGHA